jgi:lysyl-tRNA synthetase class 2
MVKSITGGYVIQFHPDGPGTEKVLEMDFTPPFRRIPFIKGLEERMGVKLPTDLTTDEVFYNNYL